MSRYGSHAERVVYRITARTLPTGRAEFSLWGPDKELVATSSFARALSRQAFEAGATDVVWDMDLKVAE